MEISYQFFHIHWFFQLWLPCTYTCLRSLKPSSLETASNRAAGLILKIIKNNCCLDPICFVFVVTQETLQNTLVLRKFWSSVLTQIGTCALTGVNGETTPRASNNPGRRHFLLRIERGIIHPCVDFS